MDPCIQPCLAPVAYKKKVLIDEPCNYECTKISDLNPSIPCDFDCTRKMKISDLNPYTSRCQEPIKNCMVKEDIFTMSKIPMSKLCPY